MKVLVTGGAGFIGSHVCERLLEDGHSVTCLDNFDDYYSPDVKRGNVADLDVEVVDSDLRDAVVVKATVDDAAPDYIIHEAAQAGVRASVKDPVKTADVNVGGTVNLLEAAKNSGAKKIVFASSSSVYGKIEYLPFDEKHPLKPISPYGVSKAAVEDYFRVYRELYGMEYVGLRYFTVYGPRIRPDLAMAKFTRAAAADKTLEVYGDGSKSRDFTYVSDAVDATVKALEKGNGIYNIGGGSRLTVKELAEKIISEVGSGRIEYVEDQRGDVQHTESDTSKARKELGWKPRTGFDEGLKETVDWVLNHL